MTQIIDISIDLETLGKSTSAIILAIGIADSNGIGFTVMPSVAEQLQEGRTLDDDTLLWWLGQSDAARNALKGPRVSLKSARMTITDFFSEAIEHYDEYRVWGNSPSFDCEILGSFLGSKPWPFYLERDVRTAREILESRTKPTTPHSALSDAQAQLEDVLRYRQKRKAPWAIEPEVGK